jgi:hypothetical protein
VLAGVDTVLIAATASTYAAGARMQLSFDGVDCWLYYNELYIGVSNAVNAGLTGTKFGVYSSDAGNTYDDWRSYARSGYADLGAL